MKHLTPTQAYEFLRSHPEAAFIDCRTETEFFYVGHPSGAAHVAWQEGPEWEVNPDFVPQVLREAKAKDKPVVLICRSGSRTLDAGAALEAAGFAEVINVLHGFEGELDDQAHRNTVSGWRHDGLPWEQM